MCFSTLCNLGRVRDRHINPYIFGKRIKKTFCFRAVRNLKIQISNDQKFKFPTVKNSSSYCTGEKILKHVYIPPQGPGTPYWVLPKLETIHIMVWDSLSSRRKENKPRTKTREPANRAFETLSLTPRGWVCNSPVTTVTKSSHAIGGVDQDLLRQYLYCTYTVVQ